MKFKNVDEWHYSINKLNLNFHEYLGTAEFDEVFDDQDKYLCNILSECWESVKDEEALRICSNPFRLKVASFMFGSPGITDEKVLYTKKQIEYVNKLCDKIKTQFDNSSGILINFFVGSAYRKLTKKATFSSFVRVGNPDPDSEDAVRYIDQQLRVYFSWTDFVRNNRMRPLLDYIRIPKNGKYALNEETLVAIEPDTSFQHARTIKGLSYTGRTLSTASSLTAGGLGVAACFTPMTLPIGIPMIVFGVFSGTYGVGDSIFSMVDKKTHSEDLNFFDFASLGHGIVSIGTSFVPIGTVVKSAKVVTREIANVPKCAKCIVKSLGALTGTSVSSTVSMTMYVNNFFNVSDYTPGVVGSEVPGSLAAVAFDEEINKLPANMKSLILKCKDLWIGLLNKKEMSLNKYMEIISDLLIYFNIFDPESVNYSLGFHENPVVPRMSLPLSLNCDKSISKESNQPQSTRKLNAHSTDVLRIIERYRMRIKNINTAFS